MSDETVHEDIINAENPFTEAEVEVKKEEPAEQQEESKIPEKFRGKSQDELVEMYMNLEQEKSRLGNDLGETRKIVDRLLQAEAFTQKPVQEEEDVDWVYEPDKAAQKLVQKEVGAVKQELNNLQRGMALKEFESKHGNLVELSQTLGQDFYDWIQDSKIRANAFLQGMYDKSPDQIDLDVADSLLTEWERVQDNSSAASTENREQAMKDAAMEKSSSSGTSRKKMWSRAYIRDLMKNHPETYKKHYDEIMAAYREDRLTK